MGSEGGHPSNVRKPIGPVANRRRSATMLAEHSTKATVLVDHSTNDRQKLGFHTLVCALLRTGQDDTSIRRLQPQQQDPGEKATEKDDKETGEGDEEEGMSGECLDVGPGRGLRIAPVE